MHREGAGTRVEMPAPRAFALTAYRFPLTAYRFPLTGSYAVRAAVIFPIFRRSST